MKTLGQFFSINVAQDTLVMDHTKLITGKVHLKTSMVTFPESEWDDFVVIVLEWWAKEISSMVSGGRPGCTCRFMDGPYEFRIFRSDGERWLIQFVKREKTSEKCLAEEELTPTVVIEGLLSCTRSVVEFCRHKGWDTREISALIESSSEMEKWCPIIA